LRQVDLRHPRHLPKVNRDKSFLFRSHRWSGEMWFERRSFRGELGKCFCIVRYMVIFLCFVRTDDGYSIRAVDWNAVQARLHLVTIHLPARLLFFQSFDSARELATQKKMPQLAGCYSR
jgi:hypothetical protein